MTTPHGARAAPGRSASPELVREPSTPPNSSKASTPTRSPQSPFYELRTSEESRSINDPHVPSIIVSASGMATGGRVLHHLEHLLPDQRATALVVGFAALGTRARDLVDGARTIKIHCRYVQVRSEVVDIPGFSVHADADEILQWLTTATRTPSAVYIVHGDRPRPQHYATGSSPNSAGTPWSPAQENASWCESGSEPP